MYHRSYSVFKKLKRGLKKSIVLTLIFLFAVSPLEPVFAANDNPVSDTIVSAPVSENNLPASSYGGNPDNTVSDPIISASEIAPDARVGDLPAVDENTVNLAEPKNKDKTSSPADKNKKKDADNGLQTQALSSTVGDPSSNGSSSSAYKNKLPKSDSVSGALIYDYPIVSSPGRNGLEPNLSLTYNSQVGEDGSIVGYGWALNIPYIERINRKGTDKLYAENYFNSSLSGELVLISGTSYGSKTDNGEFLKYEFSNNAWLVTDKNGTKYKFGYSAASRQDDPADASRIFKWMLEEIRDTNNNFIRYEYFKDAGQIYPSRIIYTGSGVTDGIFEIEFLREARSDAGTSYKTGFSVKTNYRINEIYAKISGAWVKKYALTYAAGGNTQRSMLKTIIESGQDEQGNITTLPATNFEYQTNNTGSWIADNLNWKSPVSLVKGAIVADVNGDGLADIMKSIYYENGNNNAIIQTTYINNGNGGWTENAGLKPPVIFSQTNNLYNDDPNYSFNDVDKGVRAADINGDGLTDLIQLFSDPYNPSNNKKKIFINTGHGWTETPANTNLPSFASNTPIHITDLNGDGLPDMISASVCETCNSPAPVYSSIYLNNGNNDWVLESVKWQSPIDLTKGGIIADLNNDGLADIMRSYYWHSVYNHPEWDRIEQTAYLNDGKGGWVEDTNLKPPIIFYDDFAEAGTYPGETGVRALDVNGDGLSDLVQSTNSVHKLFINTGHGWIEKSILEIFPFIISYAGVYPAGTALADLNGDGLFDMINARYCLTCGSNPVLISSIYLNNGPKSDLLNKINYSQGGNTGIVYKPSPQYLSGNVLLNPNLPFAIDTVYSVTHNDGLGNSYAYSYQYEGGKYYYANAFDRKFAGFGKITETDDAGHSVKTYYHQGDATNSSQGEYADHSSKIGKPYRVEIANSTGNIYSAIINKWENYDLGNTRNFVKLTQKIEQSYDGNSTHRDKAETYTYDNVNGNLTAKIQWGEVTGSNDGTFIDIGTDKLDTAISYASNPTLNVIGLPSHETTLDQNSAKIKESKYYYDGLALASADKGNLTKEEKWRSGAEYISVQKSYNSYGLTTQEIDARGNATNYAYDPYNLYPATVTNALSQQTQYAYDYSSGKAKQITDPNGYIFQTVYDGLDRPLEEKQPDLTVPTTLVTKTAYAYTDTVNPTSVKKTDYLDATNSAETYNYFDGLGRIIQTRKEAETANTYSTKDFVYNNRGLLDKESLPYFSTGSTRTAATATAALYSAYTYDALGRVTATANAVGTIANSYDDWKVTTTDAKGIAKDLYKDSYGNLVRVDEHNGANTYTTVYNYDSAGNLLKITDASGNIRNFTYNALGQRLTAEDLHASTDATFGVWTYAYDANGNLISRLDPKNRTINYSYDALNRTLTEDYAGQAGTETAYAYDACANGVGRLCGVTNSSSVETKEYNALGLVSKETKGVYIDGGADISNDGVVDYPDFNHDGVVNTPDKNLLMTVYGKVCTTVNCGIDLNNDGFLEYPDLNYDGVINIKDLAIINNAISKSVLVGIVNFTTQHSYDYQGNNIILINPDSSQVKYIYNSAGQIEQIQRKEKNDASFANLVINFDYSSLEKVTSQSYANGSTTINTYDTAKLYRLSSKVTTLSGGSRAQDLAYAYDANGNITRIVDNSQTNSQKTTDYTYDSLNRLLSTTATGAINGQNYAETYAYDAIGNIINKNGQAYSYSGAGYANPHAVTSIGAVNYTYDDNGNLLTDGTIINVWNYDNRLTQSTIGASTINYAYDAGGQRIKYATASKTTIYPSKFYNTDGTSPIKHVYAQGQAIATIKGTGATAAVYSIATDHLTGSNVVTNSSGAVEELMDYYPFGDIRLDEKTTVDSSGNGNNGTLVNMTGSDWVAGKSNTALNFDGIDSYADIISPTPLNISGALSVSSWVYADTIPQGESGIVLNGVYTYGLTYYVDGRAWAYIHSGDNNLPVSITTSSWHHLVLTWDGTTNSNGMKLYLDGALAGQKASLYANTSASGPLYIGKNPSSGKVFDGKIDETRIYNRALTQEEITALYNNPAITNNTGLAAYWKFDEAPFSEQRKFAGHELDTETGLSYMNARYYNGKIGRFISQDPAFLAVGDYSTLKSKTGQDLQSYLSDPQGFNSYAYARNNPLAYIDETGDFFTDVFGINISNGQRGVANSFHDLGNYFRSQGYIGHGAGFVSDMAGDIAGNVANVFDPRQGTGTRIIAVGVSVLDVGSGGESKVAGKVAKSIIESTGAIKTVGDFVARHSYNKHILGIGNRSGREFGSLIQNEAQLSEYVQGVIKNPSEIRQLTNGRTAYWDNRLEGVVIHNSRMPDRSTVYRPFDGKAGFDKLK